MIRCASLLLIFSFLASADISGTKTLTATTALNLDTGNTSTSGGDLLWNGSTLVPRGAAGIYNFLVSGSTGTSLFGSLTQSNLSVLSNSVYTSTGLGGASLVVGVVFGVHTNGGNYAKVLVTANSGGSLGLQYVTFIPSNTGPTITAVENAATNIPPGLPNSAIAQGSLFVVKGSNLGPKDVVIAGTFPLQTTIGGS